MKRIQAFVLVVFLMFSSLAISAEAKTTVKKTVKNTAKPKVVTKTATTTTNTYTLQGLNLSIATGKVSIIHGMILTINDRANHTYSIDASNARIIRGGGTTTLATIKIGDDLIVQGTISTSTIVAANIIDQNVPRLPDKNDSSKGFWASIGDFFRGLFRF